MVNANWIITSATYWFSKLDTQRTMVYLMKNWKQVRILMFDHTRQQYDTVNVCPDDKMLCPLFAVTDQYVTKEALTKHLFVY